MKFKPNQRFRKDCDRLFKKIRWDGRKMFIDIQGLETFIQDNPLGEVNGVSLVWEIHMLGLTRRELETDPQGTATVLDPT